MKKAFWISAVSAALLSGCGSSEVKQAPAKPQPAPEPVVDCVFPETNTPAPGWICSEPVPGLAVSAVGIAEKSKAGLSFMRDQAVLDARGQLAEQMKVQVQKMVKQYLGTTGMHDDETVDAVASSTAKSITAQTLVGSKVYKTRVGPNGRMYVLVGITPEDVKKITEQALKTSYNNDRALWQQFKAKQSFDEMAAEIAKQMSEGQ